MAILLNEKNKTTIWIEYAYFIVYLFLSITDLIENLKKSK